MAILHWPFSSISINNADIEQTSEIELEQLDPWACPFHLETFRFLSLHGFSPTWNSSAKLILA